MPRRYPETHVLYRNLARDYPLIVRGQGCWLYDDTGREYLDACGGAYVACLPRWSMRWRTRFAAWPT